MPKTLLLADDSVTIQKVVGISFANEDVVLVTVDNGDDAVAKAREVTPDIVLADVVMPGRDGYQVCEAVKAEPSLQGVPVLLLTGTFEAFDEARAAQVGADGHITKPFEAQALVDQVNAHLARAAAAAAAPAAQPIAAPPQAPAPAQGEAGYEFFEDEASAQTAPPSAPPAAFSFDGDTSPGHPTPAAPADAAEETMVMPAGTALDGVVAPATPEEEEPLLEAFEEVGEGEPAIGDLEPELAGEPVLDPAVGRDYDVSSSDLGDSFSGLASPAPTEAPTLPGAGQPPAAATPNYGETQVVMPPPEPSPPPIEPPAVPPAIASEPSPPVLPSAEPVAPATPVAAPQPAPPAPIGAPEPIAAGVSMHAPETAAPEMPTPAMPSGTPKPEPAATALAGADSMPPQAAPVAEDSMPPRAAPVAEDSMPPRAAPVAEVSMPPRAAPVAEDSMPLRAAPVAEDSMPPQAAPEPAAGSGAPELSAEAREQIREAIEKVAWEAFGRATEGIVRQAVERIEKVAWEVVPQMAETLIREEIRRMKGEG